jgi:type I restriction enzyme S subunit
MAAFATVKLADCVDLLAGFAFKSQHFTNKPEDIPLVKGENVSQGCILWDISKRWSAADWPNFEKFHLRAGDVVVAMDRPWVPAGLKWAYIRRDDPRALLVQRCSRLRTNTPRLDQDFLRFVIGGPGFESYVIPITTGVNVPHISGKQILDYEFCLPPLPIQRRIAGILSAYDELIENSQRRIKILESMARALYREWFVHFRFPGHESVPRVPSPLGEIPQGWQVKSFDRLLVSMTGGDWGSEQPEDRETEPVVVVRGTDFDELAYGRQLRAPVRFIKPSSLVSRGLKVGDVIIENSINAKSRCVGTTLLVDDHVLNRLGQAAIAASFCKVFRPHEKELAPLMHLHARHLREDARMEYYQNVAANGIANFQAQKFSKEEHLVLPADDVERARLVEPIGAIFRNVGVLASQLANLRRTRDLLLPRLLSGQIDVEAMPA